MTFTYQARDPKGKLLEGELDAPNRDAAAQQLRQDGFTILDLQTDDDEDGDDDEPLFPRRVTRTEIIHATSQLAVMVETGILLSTALEGLAENETNPSFRKLLRELKTKVEQGEDFSTALAEHPKQFDKTYVSLIKASEATGSLGQMLDRIAGYQRKQVETVGKVKAALTYPAVMLVLAVCVTIFLLVMILPKFTPLFNRPGAKLPGITKVMMVASDMLIHQWYWWLGGVTAVVVGFWNIKDFPRVREALDSFKIHLPLLGTLFRKVAISRSIRTLGTMLASGVPVLEAIKLSANVAGNIHFERMWQEVGERITEGDRICDSLQRNPLFPRMMVQMIRSGEDTGKLDEVMLKISNYYDHEVDTTLKSVTSMVEPLMITVMGGIIGTIGMALMLPIFSLSKPH